jgi:hypothetical protein
MTASGLAKVGGKQRVYLLAAVTHNRRQQK